MFECAARGGKCKHESIRFAPMKRMPIDALVFVVVLSPLLVADLGQPSLRPTTSIVLDGTESNPTM